MAKITLSNGTESIAKLNGLKLNGEANLSQTCLTWSCTKALDVDHAQTSADRYAVVSSVRDPASTVARHCTANSSVTFDRHTIGCCEFTKPLLDKCMPYIHTVQSDI